jgi:phage-related protein
VAWRDKASVLAAYSNRIGDCIIEAFSIFFVKVSTHTKATFFINHLLHIHFITLFNITNYLIIDSYIARLKYSQTNSSSLQENIVVQINIFRICSRQSPSFTAPNH